MKQLKISIITPSYNQGEYLNEAISSIINQRYNNIEYIVIDGGSKDNSIDIIHNNSKYIHYWVSELDRGQSHAINKGLKESSGDIVAFLNSDDLYLPGAFKAVNDYFIDHPECDWLCGDTIFFGEGHPTKLFKAVVPKSAAQALFWQAHAPQPGMFWRRKLVVAGFDEKYNYCFDHDIYISLLLKGYKCHHLSVPLAAYRLHETSKTIAESEKFEQEFDLIAEKYEAQLGLRERQMSKAIRLVRKSYLSSSKGDNSMAFKWLTQAALKTPEVFICRPFWGSLKQLIAK